MLAKTSYEYYARQYCSKHRHHHLNICLNSDCLLLAVLMEWKSIWHLLSDPFALFTQWFLIYCCLYLERAWSTTNIRNNDLKLSLLVLYFRTWPETLRNLVIQSGLRNSKGSGVKFTADKTKETRKWTAIRVHISRPDISVVDFLHCRPLENMTRKRGAVNCEALTALKMSVLYFCVVTSCELQVDTNVSGKQTVSIFRTDFSKNPELLHRREWQLWCSTSLKKLHGA
jgi:hypothetical protein